MFRRESIDKRDALIPSVGEKNRAGFFTRKLRWVACRQLTQLRHHRFLHLLGQSSGGGHEIASCIRGMLRLGEHIRGDPSRVAATRQYHSLGRASGEIDRAIGADDLFGRGDITIAGTKYFLRRRDAFRSVRQSGNGLGAAYPRKMCYAKEACCSQELVIHSWANHNNAIHACDLRRDHGHDHGGEQRESSAGNVATDGIDRLNELGNTHAGLDFERPFPRQLLFRHAAHVRGGVFDCTKELPADPFSGRGDFARAHPKELAAHIRAIEFPSIFVQSRVAAPPYIRYDASGRAMRFAILSLAQLRQIRFSFWAQFQDAHQSTILFKGYSTMPCAFAAFKRGRICRTTASSMMVFTATQSESLSAEIVGFFNAGSTDSTEARSSRRTLSIKPTRVAAAIAPCSMRTMFSAFSRLAASSADLR